MFMDCPESLCNILEVSVLFRKFPDRLEPFQIVRKDFVLSGKFLYSLESFLIFWRVSGLSGKLQSVWNLSRLSGMFFCIVWKFP